MSHPDLYTICVAVPTMNVRQVRQEGAWGSPDTKNPLAYNIYPQCVAPLMVSLFPDPEA